MLHITLTSLAEIIISRAVTQVDGWVSEKLSCLSMSYLIDKKLSNNTEPLKHCLKLTFSHMVYIISTYDWLT